MSGSLPVLVYAYDVLCGWCFGFGPAMTRARAELAGEVEFELVCGGLVTGERVRPVREDRDYLIAGLQQVERTTGVVAGRAYFEGLLEQGTWISDSEPPARALRVALDMATEGVGDATSERAIDLGQALTNALYVDGQAPDDPDNVERCASAVGLDDELVRRWSMQEARESTQRWFAETRAEGVTTYPSLFLRTDEGLLPLASGAVSAERVVAVVRRAAAAVTT